MEINLVQILATNIVITDASFRYNCDTIIKENSPRS